MSISGRKIMAVLLVLLSLALTCALGEEAIEEEGLLGDAVSAERVEGGVVITTHSADGEVTTKMVKDDEVKGVQTVAEAETAETETAETETPAAETEAVETPAAEDSESRALTEDFVSRLYTVVLNRTPDSAGLKTWTDALLDGSRTAAEVIDGFFNSNEYQGSGRSNEQIVKDCYNAMLGRDPDEAGKATWMKSLEVGMTSQAILNGFVGSSEFQNLAKTYGVTPGTITLTNARDLNFGRTYFVYRLYANCLGRTPDTAGQENWCRLLAGDYTGAECASGFVFSSEIKNKHLDNESFVKMLYQTILGRGAADSEITGWADALNYTNTREYVFNGFLFSQEFGQQCSEIQVAVGSRIAEKDQTEEWQYNVKVLELCNAQRTKEGLSKLHTRQDLWEDVAMVRVKEIMESFSSTRPDGRSCVTALDDAGIDYVLAGENKARSFTEAATLVNAWMKSQSHRENIMSSSYTDMAVGYALTDADKYRTYWVQTLMNNWEE